MRSQFIEQIQLLMETQHIKYTESVFGNQNNYMWLCTKKPYVIYWMTTRDEIRIRNCLNKINPEQEIKVLKEVLTYLEVNPNCSPNKVPEITLTYLEDIITTNIFKQVQQESTQPFSRMASFRNSLRRLSGLALGGNKTLAVPEDKPKQRRSVTFKDVPTVFRISIHKYDK